MSSLLTLTLLLSLAAEAPAPRVADLAWMAGCWSHERGEPGSGETWMAPAAGTMLGVSRIIEGGETVEYEFLLLRELATGGVEYVAKPSGQAETAFRLITLTAEEAVFENLAHDFPQRVIYRRGGADRLDARIEGFRRGQLRGFDFPMKRKPCP